MSIESGKAKYARKLAAGGTAEAKYNAAKGNMVNNWVKGLSDAGVAPGPISTAAYRAGVSAAVFRGGNADKWERNFRQGISR